MYFILSRSDSLRQRRTRFAKIKYIPAALLILCGIPTERMMYKWAII